MLKESIKMKFKYPKNQIPKVTYYNQNHIPIYVITQDKSREYYLYKIEDSKLIKLKHANEPIKFNEYATQQIKKG
jgi:hypothetical protein